MNIKSDISFIVNRSIPFARGLLDNWNNKLVKAKLSQYFLGRFKPFEIDGYIIDSPSKLIGWFDLVIEKGAFDIWPELMPENPVILDIGANHGIFGWACRQRWPDATIIGFEPNPEWFKECNNLGCYDFVYNFALGDDEKRTQLYISDKWESGTVCKDSADEFPDGYDRTIITMQKTLDYFPHRPDFIKCDVDGHELSVVQGGIETFKHAKAALIECYFEPDNAQKIAALIGKQFSKTSDYLFQ